MKKYPEIIYVARENNSDGTSYYEAVEDPKETMIGREEDTKILAVYKLEKYVSIKREIKVDEVNKY